MGKKRPHSAIDGPSKGPKPKRPSPSGAAFKKNRSVAKDSLDTKVNRSKSRIRSIRRLMEKKGDTLPDEQRRDLERELRSLDVEVKEGNFKHARSRMIGKYHMVRFYDRRKAERAHNRILSQLNKTTYSVETKILQRDLHIADVDIHYTKHFPHMRKYKSIYNHTGAAEGNHAEEGNRGGIDAHLGNPAAILAFRAERPPIWNEIEKAMEEGEAALEKIREQKPKQWNEDSGEQQPKTELCLTSKTKKKEQKQEATIDSGGHHTREEEGQGDGSGDEGGFFEEG